MTTTDISDGILWCFSHFLSMIYGFFAMLDPIIIAHVNNMEISLLDFCIGLLIIEFIFGLFLFFSPTLKGSNV